MPNQNKGTFPSDTQKNPKDCMAIQLRSGKDLSSNKETAGKEETEAEKEKTEEKEEKNSQPEQLKGSNDQKKKEGVPAYTPAVTPPDPGPTRLANPNRFRGVKPYTGTPYFYFFIFSFSKLNLYMLYTNNFCNNQQSFTFTNVLPPEWYALKFIHIY